jgi:Mg/Co/Ni transporter MgtE
MDDNQQEPQPLDVSSDGGDNNENSSEAVIVKKITPEHLSDVIEHKNKDELERIFSEVPDIDIAEAASRWTSRI